MHQKNPTCIPITDIDTLRMALNMGAVVQCSFEGSQFHTTGEAKRVDGKDVVVEHWGIRTRIPFECRGVTWHDAYVATHDDLSQADTSRAFNEWLDAKEKASGNRGKYIHPNLGVNWPAGDSWGAANYIGQMYRYWQIELAEILLDHSQAIKEENAIGAARRIYGHSRAAVCRGKKNAR